MTRDNDDTTRPAARSARSRPDREANPILDREQWIARALAAAANRKKRPPGTG